MDGILCLHSSFHNMFTLPSFQNMFTIISRKRRCKTDEATNLIWWRKLVISQYIIEKHIWYWYIC
jgi:hypothetical protein